MIKNWFERLYNRISGLAGTKWGSWTLLICAFADASFMPLPVTTFFLILILLNNKLIIKYLLFVITGTLAGAIAGYSIGHFAWIKPDGEFTGVVQFLFNNIPGFSAVAYEKVHHLFIKWDFWILCGAVITPLPYGIFSVSSGVFDVNLFIFFIATMISQGIKFLVLSIFTLRLGPKVKKLMDLNWQPLIIITSVTVLIAIFVIRAL